MCSVRVWVGVQVWTVEKKFWIGWGERLQTGIGAQIHSVMPFPPDGNNIETPVNHIYQIPRDTVYGPGINVPPGDQATAEINIDHIRELLLEILF
jgi:hypothetical protein